MEIGNFSSMLALLETTFNSEANNKLSFHSNFIHRACGECFIGAKQGLAYQASKIKWLNTSLAKTRWNLHPNDSSGKN